MKNLSIAVKLYLAFGIVVAMTVIIGGISIWRLGSVTNTFVELQTQYFKIADDGMESIISLLTARRHEKDFIARKDKKYIGRMEETLQEIQKLSDDIKAVGNQLGLTDIASVGPKVITAKNVYKAAFDDVAHLISERGNKTEGIEGELRKHAHETEEAIKKLSADKLMIEYLNLRRYEKDLLLREDMKYVKSAQDVLKNMETYARENFTESESNSVMKGANAYLKTFEALADNIAGVIKDYPVMSNAAHDMEELLETLEKDVMTVIDAKQTEAIAGETTTIRFLYIISGIITLAGLALSFFSVRSITKPLNLIILGLNEGANQVTSASNQVSSSSQSLAEGSSEQAASIEETSSSMEEMSSMTNKNSENAGQADSLMQEANQVVTKANKSMGQLTHSMEDISKASEETSKIIKTIDEIAFQTNLLALNAAVEAARAGEAGAGFAVVADEVRNLAMRAADAAKTTAELIEGTVTKVNQGSELVSSTNDAFSQVAESTNKVGNLVAEISEASKEQASGIEQVNTGISEMDKVVQSNAASAEESASAAEEMNAQAESLKEYVGELVLLISGNNEQRKMPHTQEPVAAPHQMKMQKGRKNEALKYQKKEVKPDQVIPFDDEDDFKDF